jgi:hypothetical protein
MRGAALFALVNRVVRQSCGIVSTQPFREDFHPASRKLTIDGVSCCEGVMEWFLRKVSNLARRILI